MKSRVCWARIQFKTRVSRSPPSSLPQQFVEPVPLSPAPSLVARSYAAGKLTLDLVQQSRSDQSPGVLTYDWIKNGGQVSVPALSRCLGLVTLQQYLEVLLFVLGVSHFSKSQNESRTRRSFC